MKKDNLPSKDEMENARLEIHNTIPIIEEQLSISKSIKETGKIQIQKQIREEEIDLSIPLKQQKISVERVEKNEEVEQLPKIRQEGDTTIISVVEERAVVVKKWVLVEEIRITRHQSEMVKSQKINLKKEEVKIERKNPDPME